MSNKTLDLSKFRALLTSLNIKLQEVKLMIKQVLWSWQTYKRIRLSDVYIKITIYSKTLK
jgi:hypothetical protein